ncbi:MAG: hypothetical protein DRP61_00140 [Candidatus Omnitrophota bacterium]|nr:MAG: hypothetical protein DRP61_00140 [Candidatus Omnitrophota bacterium]RKY35395.1 MAG: hypothetical protein DRP69_01580 [Candidatus Omnitrophota bacterium]RKY44882.1 MAG: hypothetical protein DRP80_00805 [Candidatus Omnitrophota bacterium]
MKRGFTLLELITVVIIIGILATIAVPQFFKVAERGRAAEAINLLGSIRSAQLRYCAEHARVTDNFSELDVETTGNPRFFTLAPLGNANPSNDTPVAQATRNDVSNFNYGNYVLQIQFDGDITCSGGRGNVCTMLGYGS